MFGIANAILHNDWQAEDAVHEAFVRMVPYLSRCKDVNDEKTKILIVRVIKSAAIVCRSAAASIVFFLFSGILNTSCPY